MSENTELDLHAEKIAQEIENGLYFTKARRWYSLLFHSPIAERSYYTIVIILSMVNVYFAILSFVGIFPLKVAIPFATYTDNIQEDMPQIRKLAENKLQDKNEVVMKYMLKQYVINRESYDLSQYEVRYRNIWSSSSSDVFEGYKQLVAAENPLSPYHQFTNLAQVNVQIESIAFERTNTISTAHLVFRKSVVSTVNKQLLNSTKWQVDIQYKYSDFKVDQRLTEKNNIALMFGLTENSLRENTEKSKFISMSFTVIDYKLKELLE